MFFFRKLTVIGQIKNDPHLFRMFLEFVLGFLLPTLASTTNALVVVLEFVLGFFFPFSLTFASASAFASVFRHWHAPSSRPHRLLQSLDFLRLYFRSILFSLNFASASAFASAFVSVFRHW